MKEFLSSLQENGAIIPPAAALNDIENRFQNPINIEWSLRDDHYEAIFYSGAREQIARYSKDGRLINYKINISPPVLPGMFMKVIEMDHELMNVVKIVTADGTVSYEIITRDNNLTRYLVNLDSSANVLLKTIL